jgi:hypothetical protein
VAERRLIAEHARSIPRPVEVATETTAERLVVEAHALLGEHRQDDYGFVTTSAGAPPAGSEEGDGTRSN